MDSTFLGVLAHFALSRRHAEPPLDAPCLYGASEKLKDLLDNLGVLQLFQLMTPPKSEPLKFIEVKDTEFPEDKTDQTMNCLIAHRTLMSLRPENVELFQDVAKFLEEDLDRQKKGMDGASSC